MSAHYLVDLFANPFANASILDVRNPPTGQSLSNGVLVVRVPDGVRVQRPVDYTDLVTQKYAGLLGFYAGFTRIAFDDLIDVLSVNTATSSKVLLGDRSSIALYPAGVLETVSTPLSGAAATQAILLWETYEYTDADDKNDRFQRTYSEVPSDPSNITCQVSFNGGLTFNAITDGATLNIPLLDQGTNLVVRFTNASLSKLFLGSWALIY